MYIDVIFTAIGLLGLLVGTITDFKKREVADWINYGMVFTGIGLRILYSIINLDWQFLVFGLLWFGIAYGFGLIMYYSGQWGGGDVKMIMGLGALFGTAPIFFNSSWDIVSYGLSMIGITSQYNLSFMLHFLFNSFFIGSIYGILWTIGLVILNWKPFKKTFKKMIKNKYSKWSIATVSLLFIGGYITLFVMNRWDILLQTILWMTFAIPFLTIFVKAVEKSAMIRMMKIDDLTEGEWIVEDVKIDGKYICGPKDLGVTLKAIKKLRLLQKQKKIDAVKVKIGIPFVPAFLMAFVFTIFFGNIASLIVVL